MVSLGRSGLALLSLARSSSAFQVSSKSCRRTLLATGLVAVSFSHSLPSRSATSSACEISSSSKGSTRLGMSSITGYLNAVDATALDVELMSTPGFSLEQLMELAGLSVAEAVYQVVPPATNTDHGRKPKILLVCGPGNNGGDGLVAARHLVFFGYETVCIYPKRSTKQHFVNLVHQCQDVGVEIVDEMPSYDDLQSYSAIVDAIFGFSFHGEPREPFATALQVMIAAQTELKIPVISVDVPSGWNVDEGDVAGTGFVPEVLVSLTTPKESAKNFPGRHFVGGRFLPPRMAEKYNIKMPPYPGVSQVMEITDLEAKQQPQGESTWEEEYAAYLAEKDAADELADASSNLDNDGKPKKDEEDSWEAQYSAHCIEKEARLAQEDALKTKEDSWEAQYAADCGEKEAQLADRDLQRRKEQP